MSAWIKSIALMSVIIVVAAGASPAEAAPNTGSQGSLNSADLYYDYMVLGFDSVLGGWHELGPYDTRQQAISVAYWMITSGYYEDVQIIRINAWRPSWYR